MQYNIEEILFLFVGYVKRFHSYLTEEYNLNDIPYNVSGKSFPKTGKLVIDNNAVDYHFHGRGCTFYWNDIEVFFNTDASSRHQIMIGAYGMKKFIETLKPQAYIHEVGFEELTIILEELEKKGVLMMRHPNDLGSWHVNELWYQACKEGKVFTGWNKRNIDWV